MIVREHNKTTILLVEDDDVDAMGLERSMRKINFSNPLVRARDGVEALEILRSKRVNKPYIILLDLNMPKMGGLEMLDVLRQDESISDSIVFILTTSRNEEEISIAHKYNVAGYIVKSSLSQDFNKLLEFLGMYCLLMEFPA